MSKVVTCGSGPGSRYALFGNGGMNGVPANSKLNSRLCPIQDRQSSPDLTTEYALECMLKVQDISIEKKPQRALFSSCDC